MPIFLGDSIVANTISRVPGTFSQVSFELSTETQAQTRTTWREQKLSHEDSERAWSDEPRGQVGFYSDFYTDVGKGAN